MDFSQSSQYQTYVPESISYREDVIPSHALSENEQTGGVHGFNVPTEFVRSAIFQYPIMFLNVHIGPIQVGKNALVRDRTVYAIPGCGTACES